MSPAMIPGWNKIKNYCFITLSSENIIVIVRYTFFNSNLQCFLDFFYFIAFTFFASILFFHYFSLTFTITTSLGWLWIHTWTELDKFLNCTLTFTFCTFLNVLTSFTIAIFAVSISLNFNVFHTTIVNLIESDLNFNKLWFGFSGTWFFLSSCSTKETENITESACSSRWASTLDTFLSIFVVKLSFLWIC